MNKVTSGALWEKQTSKGDTYYSGSVEIDGAKYQVSFFKNNYKKEDKHPDWKTIPEKPVTGGGTNFKKDPANETQSGDLPF